MCRPTEQNCWREFSQRIDEGWWGEQIEQARRRSCGKAEL
jgi:hypothetical protein